MYHKNKIHISGLDILKITTLLSITVLHSNEFIFYTDEFPLGKDAPLWIYACYFGRLFALGGQILISIIFFLIGFNQKSRAYLFKISAFSILGQSILFLCFKIFEWDIYSYLFFTTILIGSNNLFFLYRKYVLYFSLAALLIPNSFYENLFSPNSLFSLIFGTSSLSPTGSWPLFPWFFLALLFYQLGLKIKLEWNHFQIWRKNELTIWFLLFILSIPFLGHYYNSPLGPNFYRFTFHEHSIYFWANFLPFIFLGRISLLSNVQSTLQTSRLTTIISKSSWNKFLAESYITSIFYLGIGMQFREYFYQNPAVFDIYFLGTFFVPEIIIKLFFKIAQLRSIST